MLAAPGCSPDPYALFVGHDPAPTRIGGAFVPFSARTNASDAVDHTVVFVAPVSGSGASQRVGGKRDQRTAGCRGGPCAEAAAPLVPAPEPSWRLAASGLPALGRRMRR